MTNPERFENKVPQHKAKKELILFTLIGSIMLSTFFYYNFIQNPTFIPSNIPAIYILCNDEINSEDYVDCVFDLNHESIDAKIKFRGVTNANRAKKGYRIELLERKSLLGMRIDNDWILFSLIKDHGRMNVKLSMDLWRSLKSENPTAILPATRYVRLYLNEKFQGLYLLSEKNDRRLFELDTRQRDFDTSFIFQVKFRTTLKEYEKILWEQDYPNLEDINVMDVIAPNLLFFINNSTDSEFFNPSNGIYSKFDKLNLIDFFVFNFFILHKDFWNRNYFIIRNTIPSKLLLVPWDFDGSFGTYSSLIYDSTENPELEISEKNELFNRLMKNEQFMEECKEHWFYLREKLWTEDFILDKVSEMYEEIRDILEIELSMWDPNTIKEKDFELNEYAKYLFDWIPERLEFCDLYFSEF